MRTVTAERLLFLDEADPGWQTIRVAVGPRKDPIQLSMRLPTDFTERPINWHSLCRHLEGKDVRYRIHHWSENQLLIVEFDAPRQLIYGHPQPLGLSHYLVVARRAREESERNAHIYDRHGHLLESFPAGDGIEDIQVTEAGQIWVSFFDEGVFSNRDRALGHDGLVCLDGRGNVLFRYNQFRREANLPPIHDCYALNVAGDNETWVYYYSDFPLVQLRGMRLERYWLHVPVRGSHAVAITGEHVLLAGDYNQKDGFFLMSLGTGDVERIQPADNEGQPLQYSPQTRLVYGRGSRIYLMLDTSLWGLDLRDLVGVERDETPTST